MVAYILEWATPGGGKIGIEDYEDGKPAKSHFFADQYPSLRQRFQVWQGGCGCGGYDTLPEALQGAYEAAKRMRRRKKETILELKRDRAALSDVALAILSVSEGL